MKLDRCARLMCWMTAALMLAVPLFGEEAEAPRVRVGGFADLELHSSSEGDREGLDLVQLDLYSSAALSARWSALVEGTAERSLRGSNPGGETVDLDLERLYIAYSHSDAFRLEIGQTHTGIVRWNEREHRSRFLQTPIDVPAMARRPQADGAWPLRFVGLWVSGRIPGPLGLSYGSGIGAGSGRNRDETPIFGSDRSIALVLSLTMAPDAVPGFDVSAAAYAGRPRAAEEPLRERDVTFSINYVRSGTEVRAEWGRMNHTASDVVYRTTGYYALVSKRLSGRGERARPYFLIDRLRVPGDETYLAEVSEENAWAGGVRYDISNRFSIKGEYRSQRAPNGEREALLGLQIGLSF